MINKFVNNLKICLFDCQYFFFNIIIDRNSTNDSRAIAVKLGLIL